MKALWVFVFLISSLSSKSQKIIPRLIERDEAAEFERVDSFRTLHLMFAGNIYQNEEQIKNSYKPSENRYDFTYQFKNIQPILNLADITVANLKTAFTGDAASPHSSPDELALAIKYSGINVVCLANSNILSLKKEELSRTQQLLNSMDIVYTGAYTGNIQRNGNNPLIIFRKGFRIALLNYMVISNRAALPAELLVNEADKSLIERDIRAAKYQSADFIIIYFDWGSNMQDIPSYSQQNLARWCFEQGAGLIVGVHPNAVMPMEFIEYYQNATPSSGLVAYSLGNLISASADMKNRNGFILDVELKKNNYTGSVKLGEYGFIPVWNYYDTVSAPKSAKVYAVPS
ncbi:MAG: CapA family protein, partial [Chitinophagales bacterium]|nr:CapA family protein [Chitinophagales bacterium]